ncbi:MAG: acyltransferase family protein, partial [Muribaculaceae bacterium]|nr:acyltransferase family protein [Muribaculaceae bacterium]
FYLGKVMHTNNMISDLSVLGFFDRLAEYPTGPYWYLHTLVICTVVYYIIYKVLNLSKMTALVLTGVILYGLSLIIAGLIWDNVIYFLIGVFIFRSGKTFTHMISPSAFAVIPLVILFLSPANFHNGSLAGIAITILMISFLLFLYKYCPSMLSRLFTYLGKNSLAIVVFSPLFTVVSKYVMPYFSFDPTSICFYIVATIFVVACCLVCAKLFDVLRLSRFIFIKEKFYVNY